MKTRGAMALAAAALLLAGAAAASSFEELGRELAAAARAAGVNRVAMGRVEAAGDAAPGRGPELEERVLAALVRAGSVQVLERAAVPELMSERLLARTGAVEGAGAPEKRLAAAEAVVLGRYYLTRDGALALTARLVTVDAGVIVAAGTAVLDPGTSARPALVGFSAAPALADSSDMGCRDASGEVRRLLESVLDLKARYWARRARAGETAPGDGPGAAIPDPLLRAAFLERVDYWRRHRRVPPLSADEVKRFIDADGRAFTLRRDCAL
ncbi:MAG: hypothetical protein SF051_15290 [Elusimicrobiota bacterium]|nr:hypothetical protein [Elusimicrobiota bacterium]